jgi:toxin-antitoxin system PIN domain toxin
LRAVDTNVLVFSEITSSPHHRVARSLMTELAEGAVPWAIPWPCLCEFLRVVTHPRVFSPPMPMAIALHDLNEIFKSPSLILLSETERHFDVLQTMITRSGAAGNLIHDAHVAALCVEHGVRELITGDRDFARFGVPVFNPFAE